MQLERSYFAYQAPSRASQAAQFYGAEFIEGLARVELNGQHGFINQKGEEVVPFEFDRVEHFSEGYAAVMKDRKWGFIKKP